jgi:hypothetical protein
MLDVDAKAVTAWFFDRADVAGRLDPAVKKALSRFGAFVRQRARSSLRTRQAVSAPGSPPSSHEGTLKKLLYFAFDPAAESVVVGPARGGKATGAPETLEGGGAVTADGQTLHYAPRPFMAPAFAAELPKAADGFKDLIV